MSPPARTPRATLTDPTWLMFASRHWEQSAAGLPAVLAGPLITPAELFAALCAAAVRFRAGDADCRFSFWINARQTQEFTSYLPTIADRSLSGYYARVRRDLHGAEFTVLLAEPHAYDAGVWQRVRLFVRGLYRHVGIPCGGVDTGVFLGQYLRTPFGVHRGQMSVLTFPVQGTKRFRLWPRDYGEAHEDIRDALRYDAHLEASFEITGGPGDMLYWPADLWHIAEGSEDFTAALNVGCWWDRPPLTRTLLALSHRLTEVADISDARGLTVAAPAQMKSDDSGTAPGREWQTALTQLRTTIESPALEADLTIDALRFHSADGFRVVPEMSRSVALSVTADTRLTLRAGSRILHAGTGHGLLHVGADGHAVTTEDGDVERRLLTTLGSGRSVSTRAVLSNMPRLASLLNWLAATGAVTVERTETRARPVRYAS